MMSPTLTIARTTFLEAVRQPIYFIMVLLCGVALVLTTWGTGFSLGYTESGTEVSGDDQFLLQLALSTVFLCGTLLAGFIATAAMSREIENKTVLTIVSKPVPRPVVVLGKYLGVTAAVMIAVATMLLGMMLALRHGVLTAASQEVDGPVVVFASGAFVLSMVVGAWGNFFYGWSFPQATSLMLCPLMALAYAGVLVLDKHWAVQAIGRDFKPQILTTAIVMAMAIPILCSIAVAASTRLGQVMTLVVCFGALLLGLLSSGLIGARAYANAPLGRITGVEIVVDRSDQFAARATVDGPAAAPAGIRPFSSSGDTYAIKLKAAPPRAIQPGDPVYYGPFPNGFDLAVPTFTPFAGDPADEDAHFSAGTPPALMATAFDPRSLRVVVKQVGESPVQVTRPPQEGDYVFGAPTRVNAPALAVWGVVPNLQSFWLVDAVTQNQPVPASHVGLVGLYALTQVIVFLAVAVLLFQGRDVG